MRILLMFSVVILTACGSTRFSGGQKAPRLGDLAGATGGKTTTIAITPGMPTLSAGDKQQFTATATLPDGSTKDITKTATWALQDAAIAKFSDASGNPGLVMASKAGTTEVTASDGSVTGTATLTVTAATLKGIAITPTALQAATGATVQAKAVGTYSDGSTADITSQVVWSSTDSATGTIATQNDKAGLFTAVAAGSTTVKATLNGVSASVPATVLQSIACNSSTSIILAGGSAALTWSGSTEVEYSIKPLDPASGVANLGAVVAAASGIGATYTAPAIVAAAFDAVVTATPKNKTIPPADCEVRIAGTGGLGVIDDGKTQGLVGNVYKLAVPNAGTSFATVIDWTTNPKSVASILVPNLDVPTRDFTLGFPGVSNLTEWFAIRFSGKLTVPAGGVYTFQLMADDGALAYIDGALVVSADGVHATATVSGAPVTLTAGVHTIKVDYFQGPATSIALSLLWKGPADTSFVLIDKNYISRP